MTGWLNRRCSGWALWRVPKRVLSLVFVVNILAVLATIATALGDRISTDDVVRFITLVVCAWVSIELTRRIERRRSFRLSAYVAHVDTKGTWNFAALLILPSLLVSATVILTYFVSWFRVRRDSSAPHRWIYSASTVLLATHAAAWVLAVGMPERPYLPAGGVVDGLAELGVVTVAAGLRWFINGGLVMLAIALSSPKARLNDLFNGFSQQLLEAGAAGIGLALAFVMVTNPLVLPGIIIAMITLHHAFLLSQYERESRTDPKTGLATAGWWYEHTEQTLARSTDEGTTMGLIVIDLDHFKAINDTYGHPFGDEVLRAVAGALRTEIRDDDACGRWGGEEFAVVLPDIGSRQNLWRAAERVRGCVRSVVIEPPAGADAGPVGVTASIGGALYPADAVTTLDELLIAADSALYEAKNSGRDAVCIHHVEPEAAT